jgi:TonB family protein
MLKPILIIFFGLFLFQTAKAQRDTAILYVKNSGNIVQSKDSADYFIMVFSPDTTSGKNLFPVRGYYLNGKPKFVETVEIVARRTVAAYSSGSSTMIKQGPCINFFPDGKKKSIENYIDGVQVGDMVQYYPNGKIYAITKVERDGSQVLVGCRDSTGKMLADNGNGEWLKYNNDFKKITGEGPVKDGHEDGTWHGIISDTSKYELLYVKGKQISGIGYDSLGKAHSFTTVEVTADYKGGLAAFYKFLQYKIHYPTTDKTHKIQGKVYVTFLVNTDGSLTNVKALKGPDETLMAEAVRAVKLSPRWNPGYRYGMVVPVQYTVPLAFSLEDNNNVYKY